MKQHILDALDRFQGATPQQHGGITIIPLLAKTGASPAYISLSQALQSGELMISEISEGGRVPELKVVNKGKHHVLILAGEELRGAKQNRVLNTSVLVAPESELVVPVSCTEAGRWAYRSREFSESGNMMSPSIKSKMMNKVCLSLQSGLSARADQGEVWEEIDKLQSEMRVTSHTGAMADVYENIDHRLEDVLGAFPLLEGQCGVYALLGESFAGLELVSSPEAWRRLHAKIVKSYAMDALRYRRESRLPKELKPDLAALLQDTRQRVYPGIGLGEELRFDKPGLTGSALIWGDEIIHLSVFPHQDGEHSEEVFHRHMRARQ